MSVDAPVKDAVGDKAAMVPPTAKVAVPDVDKLPAIAAPPALTVKPCWKVVKPEMSTLATSMEADF